MKEKRTLQDGELNQYLNGLYRHNQNNLEYINEIVTYLNQTGQSETARIMEKSAAMFRRGNQLLQEGIANYQKQSTKENEQQA